MKTGVPRDVAEDVMFFRYRERLHLSYQQALEEPNSAFEHALLIWSLDADRAKLEEERERFERPHSNPNG